MLYRELIRSGVSEYIVLPTSAPSIVSAITELFAAEGAAPIGRTIGFVSAKGGSGSSTVAHNVGWAISQHLRQDVLILDLDLAFGTAGLNFNQDPPHGIADALTANQKMDQVMLDRLMSKAANHVNLLTAPVVLDRTFDFAERDFEQIIELSQKSTPVVILDIPHIWTSWVRHTIATIDEIIIVAEPDLANLRNAKNLSDTIKALRPTESEPLLVINKIGVPRRPEIAPAEFATSVECRLLGQIAVRRRDLRHGRQQWPDARRSLGQQSHQRHLSDDRHARDRPQLRRTCHRQVHKLQTALLPEAGIGRTSHVRQAHYIRRQYPGRLRRLRVPRGAAPCGARTHRTGNAQSSTRRRQVSARKRRGRRCAQRRGGARDKEYFQTKSAIFNALIDSIDLSQLATMDQDAAREEIRDIVAEIIALKSIVMSISEQEDLLEDICNDVLGYGPLEPLLARDDIADIMVNGSQRATSKSAAR